MKNTELGFTTSQTIYEGDDWKHVLEDKVLYITDKDNNLICKISGKDQLISMCKTLGLVGTVIKL